MDMSKPVKVLDYTIPELEHFIIYFKEEEGSDNLIRTVAFLEAENEQLREKAKRLEGTIKNLRKGFLNSQESDKEIAKRIVLEYFDEMIAKYHNKTFWITQKKFAIKWLDKGGN